MQTSEVQEYEGFGEPDRDTGDSEYIENPDRGNPVPKGGAKQKRSSSKSKSVDGTACTTFYPNLPVLRSAPPNLLSFSDAASYLFKKYGYDWGLVVFAAITAEARRKGNNYSSAGGHNYCGVQTDAGKWGNSTFVGQFCKKDAVRYRMFAAFENDEVFMDFVADKAKRKKMTAIKTGEGWVERYLNSWVFLDLQGRNPSLYKEYFPLKLAIYKTAKKRYDLQIKLLGLKK